MTTLGALALGVLVGIAAHRTYWFRGLGRGVYVRDRVLARDRLFLRTLDGLIRAAYSEHHRRRSTDTIGTVKR